MDKSTLQLVISAITAVAVFWNAVQLDRVASKVHELTGKIETIARIFSEHLNTPALHSMRAAPEILEDWAAEGCAPR